MDNAGKCNREARMLDMIAAVSAGALCAAQAGLLISLVRIGAAARILAIAGAIAWLAAVVSVTSLGLLAPGTAGALPMPLLISAGLLAVLLGSFTFAAPAREALLSVPLPVLIATNIGRLGGAFFLLLYADGRLSAPFAPAAAIGDIITGALAIPLALSLGFGSDTGRFWVRLWNAFGILDLVVAISLAALSSPGITYRVFMDEPGARVLTTLPWALVPLFLVPVYLLIHFVIAAKLKSQPQRIRSMAVAT
jgi:hypothetical protein